MDAKELFNAMKGLRQESERQEMLDGLGKELSEIPVGLLNEVAHVTVAGPDICKQGLDDQQIAALVVMARFGVVLWSYRDVFLAALEDFSDDTVLEGATQ